MAIQRSCNAAGDWVGVGGAPDDGRAAPRISGHVDEDPARSAGRGGQQSFADWTKATDASPPDSDALPKINGLPDPFTFMDGKRRVRNQNDWKARR